MSKFKKYSNFDYLLDIYGQTAVDTTRVVWKEDQALADTLVKNVDKSIDSSFSDNNFNSNFQDSVFKDVFKNLPVDDQETLLSNTAHNNWQMKAFKDSLKKQLSNKVVGSYLQNRGAILDIMANDSTLLNIHRQKNILKNDLQNAKDEVLVNSIKLTDSEFNDILHVKGTGFKVGAESNFYTDAQGNYLYETGSGGYATNPENNRVNREKIPDSYDQHNIHKYKQGGKYRQNIYTSRFGTDENYFNIGNMIAEVKTSLGTEGDLSVPSFYEFANFYLKDLVDSNGNPIFADPATGNLREFWKVEDVTNALTKIDGYIASKVTENDDLTEYIAENVGRWDPGTNRWQYEKDMGEPLGFMIPKLMTGYHDYDMYGGSLKQPGDFLSWGGGDEIGKQSFSVFPAGSFIGLFPGIGDASQLAMGMNPHRVGADILDYFDLEVYDNEMSKKNKMSEREVQISQNYHNVITNSRSMHEYEKGRMILHWLLNGRGFAGNLENFNTPRRDARPGTAAVEDVMYGVGSIMTYGLPQLAGATSGTQPYEPKSATFGGVDMDAQGNLITASGKYNNEVWGVSPDSTYYNNFVNVLSVAPTYVGDKDETRIPLRSEGGNANKVYFSGVLNESPTLHDRTRSINYRIDNLNRQLTDHLSNNYGDILEGDVGMSLDSLFSYNEDFLDKELEKHFEVTYEKMLLGTGKDETSTKAYSEILDIFKQNLKKGNYKFFLED